MATFPDYKPVYSASKKSEPRIRRASFATGYEQRTAFGLNTNPKQWSLEFNLSEEDASIVEAFLDARAADCQSFTWTPPDSGTAYKWICSTWDKSMFDLNRSRITATFTQVFEPISEQVIVVDPWGDAFADWVLQNYGWQDAVLLDWWGT